MYFLVYYKTIQFSTLNFRQLFELEILEFWRIKKLGAHEKKQCKLTFLGNIALDNQSVIFSR